jgi:hypothetical protein
MIAKGAPEWHRGNARNEKTSRASMPIVIVLSTLKKLNLFQSG